MASMTPAGTGLLRRLGLHRPVLRSWALYDWANSAFATTIMAAVLPIYFARVAAGGLEPNVASAYWGYTAAIGLLLVALASPVLGAMADFLGAKKRFLAAFMLCGAVATAALWTVREGDWLLAAALYVVASIGFTGSLVFYYALLPHIAADDEIDRVSTGGWALGYVGGGLLLAVNAVMIARPDLFGFADAGVASRVAFLTVAVWWIGFSIPVLTRVPEPVRELAAGESAGGNPLRAGFGRLAETLHEIRQYPDLVRFLAAYWFYSDGIGTIIKLATVYGTELGIGQGALIGALLLTQFVGVPFTFLFGAIADRIGAKNGIFIALAAYLGIAVAAYFVTTAWHFFALAFAVGTVQGGAQSLSRSMYASMIPRAKSGEFFSFYATFDKFAGLMGPILFGVVAQLTGTSRLGIAALVAFFIAGMLLLRRVDPEAGRRAARQEDATLAPVVPTAPAP